LANQIFWHFIKSNLVIIKNAFNNLAKLNFGFNNSVRCKKVVLFVNFASIKDRFCFCLVELGLLIEITRRRIKTEK